MDGEVARLKAYINGKIYTMNDDYPVVEAFLIKDDRFIAVGKNDEIISLAGEEVEVIDLEGKVVLPGLIDSHLHVNNTGIMKKELNLQDKSREEILDLVKEAYLKSKEGEWVTGRGWNHTLWEDSSFPTKEELDSVAPDMPVYLKRACGHASWANSLAFRLAGIDEDTEDPVGGEILRNAQGGVGGVVTDQAQDFFDRAIPPYTPEQYGELAKLAEEEFISNGITSIHDCGTSWEVYNVWRDLYKKEELKIRIYTMLRVVGRPSFDELITTAKTYFNKGIRVGEFNNRLTARCFKLSGDGSLGARSAWMLDDFSDRPGHKGNGKLTDQELYEVVYEARRAGFQVSVHSIGDASNRQTLNIYEKVLNEIPCLDHRFRIEHAQILSPSDIPRFAELRVLPTIQGIFIASDRLVAEERLGPERMKGAYAWRSLINNGSTILPNGTDSPVEPVNPFLCMYATIARKDINNQPENGWYVEEALDREEALKSYTIWAAYAGFEEEIKGSISRGKLADFIIIDRDYMNCPIDEIKDIKIFETVIGGETVYKNY